MRASGLAKLGPPLPDGAPKESADVTAQRKRLEAEAFAIDGRLKRADILFLRANQLTNAANNERRERFMDLLFDPVPNFYSFVLPIAARTAAAASDGLCLGGDEPVRSAFGTKASPLS